MQDIARTEVEPGIKQRKSILEGRFPVGLASGDPDFGTLGTTGGSKTHTHGSTSGTTGTVQGTVLAAAANHLPPYRVVKFTERYQ